MIHSPSLFFQEALMSAYFNDPDPAETNDWLQSLDGVIADRKSVV